MRRPSCTGVDTWEIPKGDCFIQVGLYFISIDLARFYPTAVTVRHRVSSFSARASEFGSTSPSDVTACEDDMSGGEENRRNCDVTFLQEAVKTLRSEIQELQTKHEVQFMTFVSKFVELEQG